MRALRCSLTLLAVLSLKWLASCVSAESIYCDDPELCSNSADAGETEKRQYMRFGRSKSDISGLVAPYMRFGRSNQPIRRNEPFLRFGKRGGGEPFLRFGKGGGEPFLRFGKGGGEPFLRFGKRGGEPFLRFGKGGGEPFLRFGKGGGEPFLRFGKGGGEPFLRFGKGGGEPFLRFGKGGGEPFLRFGKSGEPFLRFGKRNDLILRFGKRPEPFLRFGKRGGEGEETSDLTGADAEGFARELRRDHILRFGRDAPYMRFGRSEPFLRFGRPEPFLRFGRGEPFLRFGRPEPFLRFGKKSSDDNVDGTAELLPIDESDSIEETPSRRKRSVPVEVDVQSAATIEDQGASADMKKRQYMRFGRGSTVSATAAGQEEGAGASSEKRSDNVKRDKYMRFGRSAQDATDNDDNFSQFPQGLGFSRFISGADKRAAEEEEGVQGLELVTGDKRQKYMVFGRRSAGGAGQGYMRFGRSVSGTESDM